MRILVTGSSGLVGSELVPMFSAMGHSITRIFHNRPLPDLEGHDAVINFAGENIAGRWNNDKKLRIRDSRVRNTRALCETLADLTMPPKVFISASATGYYGNRGSAVLRESAPPGVDFLAEVCRDWEAATDPAVGRGIRVVNLRFGVILTPEGGALPKMLTPFRLGIGGVIGDGRQYMSWITMDDVLGVITHALMTSELRGPVNAVTPHPVTNEEFTRTLGRVLRRPTMLPMPAFAARLAFGELADALLLASQRVEPTKLLASGYEFQFPKLEGALRHLLSREQAKIAA